MLLLALSHKSGLDHDSGPGHPERAERLAAVQAGFDSSGVALVKASAPRVGLEDLLRVHHRGYIEDLKRFCAAGGGTIDADTHVGSASWEGILRSAGAGIEAVKKMEGAGAFFAFAATRPPGHHALPSKAMGFCLFNNIALTARFLADRGARVAIVDWDVHHGNGTQEVFYRDPAVFYVSLHESPCYPGTGEMHERGSGDGLGSTLNIPLPAGADGDVYRWAMAHLVVPVIESFKPDWLLISAGYDAHQFDPLARMSLLAEDYGAMAGALRDVVRPGRIILFLEGGYSLDALTLSVSATVRGFAGDYSTLPRIEEVGDSAAWRAVERVIGLLEG